MEGTRESQTCHSRTVKGIPQRQDQDKHLEQHLQITKTRQIVSYEHVTSNLLVKPILL
jgi:hypothetical protein